MVTMVLPSIPVLPDQRRMIKRSEYRRGGSVRFGDREGFSGKDGGTEGMYSKEDDVTRKLTRSLSLTRKERKLFSRDGIPPVWRSYRHG